MIFRSLALKDSSAIGELFLSAFSDSEGEEEGLLISRLATELTSGIDDINVQGFAAVDDGRIVGAIFFSRLTFDFPLEAFILSPVAVSPERQGSGIGQALINHGLAEMASAGVQLVTTYGDPSFYSKVGFEPLSTESVQPPYELSQPEGWLGQSLFGATSSIKAGRASCVAALDDPAYW